MLLVFLKSILILPVNLHLVIGIPVFRGNVCDENILFATNLYFVLLLCFYLSTNF